MLMICSFFCLLKGNLNCLPDAGFALVMLKRVPVSAVNGYSGGVEVFLSSRLSSDFFFPLLKYKLPRLFKAEVWGVLISTSSLKPFHIQMNVKCNQDYTLGTLKEWAEELVSAVHCSFQGVLTMLILKSYFIIF